MIAHVTSKHDGWASVAGRLAKHESTPENGHEVVGSRTGSYSTTWVRLTSRANLRNTPGPFLLNPFVTETRKKQMSDSWVGLSDTSPDY